MTLDSLFSRLSFVTLLLFIGLASFSLYGEESPEVEASFQAVKRKKLPPVTQSSAGKSSKTSTQRDFKGSIPKIIESKEPLQMINPFAPKSYGSGEEMVDQNPDQFGKGEGLVIFGIQW